MQQSYRQDWFAGIRIFGYSLKEDKKIFSSTALSCLLICLLAFIMNVLTVSLSLAQQKTRKGTGYPVPRFVSLKGNMVNVRQGPSNDQAIKVIFKKKGLPVEIIAEWDNWRRIRDSEGTDGWVWHSLLSGERTALITPWAETSENLSVHAKPDENSMIVARLSPQVIVQVESCNRQWCRIELRHNKKKYEGYFPQNKLWGVYPDEAFD